MRRKGTQTLLNALFIPDVRKDLRKDGKLGAVQSRNVKSCLPHQGKESHCFQGNRLSSGVGTGYHQEIKIFSQMNVNGYHLLSGKQRMTPLADIDIMLLIEERHGCIFFHGKGCLGKNEIQEGHDFLIF